MIREMVVIDESKCDGCGLCVPACAEGAIQIIDGKAKLVADNLCDGLGACLGDCPQDAITIEKREADEFDEVAVSERLRDIGREQLPLGHYHQSSTGGCPSAQVQDFASKSLSGCPSAQLMSFANESIPESDVVGQRQSELRQWPVQLHLVPPTAPFISGKELLLAADCVPFAYADFHNDVLKDRALLIACPKLDDTGAYLQKLVAMLQQNDIKKLIVAHMEVPCCSGLIAIARQALTESGVDVEFETINISIQGDIK